MMMDTYKCCRCLEPSAYDESPTMPSFSYAAQLLDWKPKSKSHRELYRFGRHNWLMGAWLSSNPIKGRLVTKLFSKNNTRRVIDHVLEKVCPEKGFPPISQWWNRTKFPKEGRVKINRSHSDYQHLATAVWLLGWHCMRHARILDENNPPAWCADRYLDTLEIRVNECDTPLEFLRFVIDLVDGNTDDDDDQLLADIDLGEEATRDDDDECLLQSPQGFWAMGKSSKMYVKEPTSNVSQWKLGRQLVDLGHRVMAHHMLKNVSDTLRLNQFRPNLGTVAMIRQALKYSAGWDGKSSPNRSCEANTTASIAYTTGGEMVNVGYALCVASHRRINLNWPEATCWKRCATWYGSTVIMTCFMRSVLTDVTLVDGHQQHTSAVSKLSVSMSENHYYGGSKPTAIVYYCQQAQRSSEAI
ncbi:hypothetical protein [Crucian carp herpesvirus]|uniref:ORF129 n=2 Tax=Cyprinid herpesvirus 2 TaxID=317878 RepID=K7PBG9_CYHV2|nr:protein ORF129 [Cyprinid herpesvirus 2]AFJ20559.1 protein ORF129 [Cyprinid herpesvirus 2]AKC02077.1 hypothetical protein [Cyprinid herpesvirus 2]AMB21703.1 ORF129 [Cyprinid herpesvirus 2]APD51589.1 hypothetical protein [Crucian carp herpesvirus]